MNNQFKIQIGALCDPISKQLGGFLLKEDAEQLDADNNAIIRCYLRGLVGDAETERARKRLLAKIRKAVAKHASETPEIVT